MSRSLCSFQDNLSCSEYQVGRDWRKLSVSGGDLALVVTMLVKLLKLLRGVATWCIGESMVIDCPRRQGAVEAYWFLGRVMVTSIKVDRAQRQYERVGVLN